MAKLKVEATVALGEAERLRDAVTDAAELLGALFASLSESGQRAVTAWLDEYHDLRRRE